ncbi:hypothetical protein [uncultured Sphingomonas sp.]|uniref:hypothetical protein n=1 Tax=uncultured Sphingomonas sp. TaxID=158754 RepID=UPI0025D50875|nr:hypothetical protein [uncultured Sphingomonas sp.]
MIVPRRTRVSPARLSLALLLVTSAPAALAQSSTPAATPTLSLPPITFSLPSGTPTPAATPEPTATSSPTPRPTPTARATPSPGATPAARATPTPRATPTARATPAARPSVAQTATPSPSQVPEPVPTASPTTAAPAPTPAPSEASVLGTPAAPVNDERDDYGWLWFVGLAALAGAGWWWWQRRASSAQAHPTDAVDTVPGHAEPVAPASVAAEPIAPAAAAAPRMLTRRTAAAATPPASEGAAQPRAWIELELRARRAGVNLVTATADVEIVVRNRGEVEARNIRLDARLTSARADQDAELGQIFAQTAGRLAATPFTLTSGAERVVRALVTLPRDNINVLTAADRPMFVPVVTLNARYVPSETAAGEGQTAQAFALGIERAGAAKLAPFWLDGPARMFETVAARPHALAVAS